MTTALQSILGVAFAVAAAISFPAAGWAQGFPVKPVRIVVPFPAGGALDTVARALGQKLNETWKQPVLVENRPGSGGNIGADVVAKAAPDGHTVLFTTHGFAISPSFYRRLPFDPIKDFVPVTQLTASYTVLVANPGVAARTLKELIDLAKARPGQLNYGSTGIGGAPQLVMEWIKSLAGIDIVHVPYKGDAELNPALVNGEVQVAILPLAGALPNLKAGRLRALGVSSPTRSAALPDVPTIAEGGLAGFEALGWLGVFTPGGTAPDIVARIQRAMAAAINQPDIKERLPNWGYEAVGSTPEEFARRVKDEIANFARIIRDARIPVQE